MSFTHSLLKLLALGLPQRTDTICINIQSLAQKNVNMKDEQEKLDIMNSWLKYSARN